MLLALGITLWTTAALAPARRGSPSVDEASEMDRVVKDACGREVVLLGEDAGHGGGRTIELKTLIVLRLIRECGFGAVLFESQFYDFLDFEHRLAAGAATRQELADAIGALWSRTAQAQPLIDEIYAAAVAGKVRVGGIDPQVGGVTGRYSQEKLSAELASTLEGERRESCAAELGRHHVWGYDDKQPFDEATKGRLRKCVADIRAGLSKRGAGVPAELTAKIASYARYASQVLDGETGARDLGMFENLEWYRGRWPRRTRTVVWCATVHASKAVWPGASFRPLGAFVRDRLGGRAHAVGFTALAGTLGRPGGRGPASSLETAGPDSIEGTVMANAATGLRYVDVRELRALGAISARALNYARPRTLDWAELLDGLVVLRKEAAAETAR